MDVLYSQGICPLSGMLIYDGLILIGTFCEDGSNTLPVQKEWYFTGPLLTIIYYSKLDIAYIDFNYHIRIGDGPLSINNPLQTCHQCVKQIPHVLCSFITCNGSDVIVKPSVQYTSFVTNYRVQIFHVNYGSFNFMCHVQNLYIPGSDQHLEVGLFPISDVTKLPALAFLFTNTLLISTLT